MIADYTIKVDIEDYDVENLLRDTERAVSGPSIGAFLRTDASDFFKSDIVERFAYEGDAASGNWEQLHPATINIKSYLPGDELVGAPEDINVRSGRMFEELTSNYNVSEGADWARLDIPGEVDPLTQVKIERAQKGSSNNPIPGFGPTAPRPVLALSEMHLATVLEILEVHIVQAIATNIGGTVV